MKITNILSRTIAIIAGIAALAACGNGKRQQPENLVTVGGGQFQVVAGSCPAGAAGALSGSCSLISPASIGGVDGGASFAIRFRLEDGGSLTLHAYSENLAGGVDLKFTRAGEVLRFTGTIGGQTVDHSRRFASISASDTIALQIDVHNSEAPAHVVVWPATAAPTFALGDKLVNTGHCGPGNDPTFDCSPAWGVGAGTGSALGITLANATLLAAAISPPKYEE